MQFRDQHRMGVGAGKSYYPESEAGHTQTVGKTGKDCALLAATTLPKFRVQRAEFLWTIIE